MRSHLKDEEAFEAAAGRSNPEWDEHIRHCEHCADKVKRFSKLIEDLRLLASVKVSRREKARLEAMSTILATKKRFKLLPVQQIPTPATATLRGTPHPLRYSTEGLQLKLLIQKEGPQSWGVTGLFSPPRSGTTVLLESLHGQGEAIAPASKDGSFYLGGLGAGSYKLTLVSEEALFTVDQLRVGLDG